MSDAKTKAIMTLEKLCDSTDDRIALEAARELNLNEQRALDRDAPSA